jgi:hypothetical protein
MRRTAGLAPTFLIYRLSRKPTLACADGGAAVAAHPSRRGLRPLLRMRRIESVHRIGNKSVAIGAQERLD